MLFFFVFFKKEEKKEQRGAGFDFCVAVLSLTARWQHGIFFVLIINMNTITNSAILQVDVIAIRSDSTFSHRRRSLFFFSRSFWCDASTVCSF